MFRSRAVAGCRLAHVVRVSAIAVVAAALVVGGTLAQARSAKPLPGLPKYTDGYRGWIKINRGRFRRRPAMRTRLEERLREQAKRGARYPYGTVIVKEGSRPGPEGVVSSSR